MFLSFLHLGYLSVEMPKRKATEDVGNSKSEEKRVRKSLDQASAGEDAGEDDQRRVDEPGPVDNMPGGDVQYISNAESPLSQLFSES